MRLFLGNSWRACTNGATNLNSASILITRSLPRRSRIPGNAVGRLFAEQRIGWQLELAAEKALPLVILTPLLNMFSNVWRRINRSLLCMAIYGRRTARLALTVPISSIQPAIGATENAIWRCCRCIPISHRRFMTAISPFRRYRWIFSTGSRFTSSTPCLIGQGCLAVSTATAQKRWIGCLRYRYSPCRIRAIRHFFSLHEA